MKPSFLPKLINDEFSDPGLFILFKYTGRAIMFDLGDLRYVSPRDLLKITHVFVTHAHMDHFIGFDALLRVFLGRSGTLHIFGPNGFFEHVEGKLKGYTWNLVDEFESDLRLEVSEVLDDAIRTRKYDCRKQFTQQHDESVKKFSGTLLEEASFSIKAELLDHRIPCMALSLEESFHVNIIKENLSELGIPVGPWINRLKNAIHSQADPESEFFVSWNSEGSRIKKSFRLKDLTEKVTVISGGQKVAYITDTIASSENRERIIRISKDADIMFIEAPFLEKDKAIASKKFHLTARQAGELAAMSGAKRIKLFHFSPRYHGNARELEEEAMAAYTSFRK